MHLPCFLLTCYVMGGTMRIHTLVTRRAQNWSIVNLGPFQDNGKKYGSVLDVPGWLATMRMADGIFELGANQ